MKKKPNQFTLEEHMQNADDLAIAFHHLNKVFHRCNKNYNMSHKFLKSALKLAPNYADSYCNKFRLSLDREYHDLIDDKKFEELGHIYYNLEKRYTEAIKKSQETS